METIIYPTNYSWIGSLLTFTYDDSEADGVWIQFKASTSNDFITILQVEGSNPKSCPLDPVNYGTIGQVRGVVKPKNKPGGFPPPGNVTNITNQTV